MTKGILLSIDDDEACLRIRELIFEMAGYEVLSADNGQTGVSLFERTPVDMVILDYSMPGLTGADVAGMMRRINPGIPILMLSGEYLEGDKLAGVVDCCMSKTEDPAKLLARIDSMVGLKRLKEQVHAGAARPGS